MHRAVALMVLVVVWLSWLAFPPVAGAQERRGFWVGIGVGFGSLGSSSREHEGNREATGVSSINFGRWVNQRWQIGIDLGDYTDQTEEGLGGPLTPFSAFGTVSYYPRFKSGFHITGGAGASSAETDIVDEFRTTATVYLNTGFGFMAGTGWDVYLGRRFWLTPAIKVRYGRPGDLVLAGRTRVSNWKYNMVDLTVGLKFD